MSDRISVLAQQLLGQPSVADCNVEDIEALIRRAPYFAPARFLLIEKLKASNDPKLESAFQKGVLYYHNPIAFDQFISPEHFDTEDPILNSSRQEIREAIVNTSDEKSGSHSFSDDVNETAPATPQAPEVPAAVEATAEQHLKTEEDSEARDESENEEAPERGRGEEGMQPPLSIHLPTPAAQDTAAEPLAFEPFHTVDYFASQGIKLSQEEAPKDKFGQQLKSFTQWLKTMKRLPPVPSATPATPSEQNVEHLAADSVHESDVVTEAMAEVWIKQSNKAKAAEVYRKLSLLNPSKTAYFAALIENLKHS